ncbi:MAG: hypothetical protein K9K38_01920 [Rhodoferax sp.]|nr:hypothetical protein [Rhodoferax sp.]
MTVPAMAVKGYHLPVETVPVLKASHLVTVPAMAVERHHLPVMTVP